jgi:hypothetical protein
VIAAVLSSTAAFAEDKFKASMENGKQREAHTEAIANLLWLYLIGRSASPTLRHQLFHVSP